MAPTNIMFREGQVAFIDFEYCGVRHPSYDGMFWRCICAFPPGVCDELEREHRRGLAEGGWTVDEDRSDRALVDAASHRIFWILGWASTAQLLDEARTTPPTRALLLHYLTEFLRLGRGGLTTPP